MKTFNIIRTNQKENQYWFKQKKEETNMKDEMNVINVYPVVLGEEIKGFGGAFTEASAFNYNKLEDSQKQNFLKSYFGETGLKYNLSRVHIHSCDFALGNYTYIEEGDKELKTFNIDHDKEQIIPMINEAKKIMTEDMLLLASPWSPPAFMKDTNEMNNGGVLLKEYYEAWTNYFVKFIKAYKQEGIDIQYVTVQNEPMAKQTWDSCVYTAEEERDFACEYLGPIFEKEGLSHIKIFTWDHNKEELVDRANVLMSHKDSAKYIKGFGVHWYTGEHFDAISLTKKLYKEQEIFFTEGCVEYSRFADSDEIYKAHMYAHDMLGNLKSGLTGFIDWNILLDEKGGPNHVGNFCASPIMLDGKGNIEKRLPYYYIGHFSRYIKRGAKLIANTKYTEKLDVVSFLNPDGEKVVIILNLTDEELKFNLRENGKGISETIKAKEIITITY